MNFAENFESDGINPPGWAIVNHDEDLTWEPVNGILGKDGNQSTVAFLDNWDYDANGEEDEIITEYFDLTTTSGAILSFDLAKAQWNANLQDGLRVEVSIDCGMTFSTIYDKEDLELSTLPGYDNTDRWEPLSPNHWRTEQIDLTPFVGETILLKFININGFGNSTYIDNINLDQTAVSINESSLSNFKIFPNPAQEVINLISNDDVAANAKVIVTSRIGQFISQHNMEGRTTSIDVSNLPAGLYFVTVISNGNSGTKKIIVE